MTIDNYNKAVNECLDCLNDARTILENLFDYIPRNENKNDLWNLVLESDEVSALARDLYCDFFSF